MTDFQSSVKNFMKRVDQPTPDSPIIPDNLTRILRVQLLMEEVLEFAEASGVKVSISEQRLTMEDLNWDVDGEVNLKEICDSLSDINYVSSGASVAYGLDQEEFDLEVCRSNDSKIDNGHRSESGKWIKGPNYSPADLKPILIKQIAEGERERNEQVLIDMGR